MLDNWLWAIFGVIVYNYLLFSFTKDKTDGTSKKFNWNSYKSNRWNNWILSFMMVPIIVIYAEQIWYYIMQWQKLDLEFYDVLFLGSGVLAEGLYFVLKKIKLVTSALKSKDN